MSTSAAAAAPAPAKFVPKVLKQVSQNLLKLRAGTVVHVKVPEKMAKAPPIKNGDKKKEPPILLPVINLETSESQVIIVGAVLVDLLNDTYPKDGYVGRGFTIAVLEKKGSGERTYNTYNVQEIEVPK